MDNSSPKENVDFIKANGTSSKNESTINIEFLSITDLIDKENITSLLETFYNLTKYPISIIDPNNNLVAGFGWQSICQNFHRVNAVTLQRCIESDSFIKLNLEEGKSLSYKCKNGLWDIAHPIMIEGFHLGTLFLGQFFHENEVPDDAYFIHQAQLFGFNESDYLQAAKNVPVYSDEDIKKITAFYLHLANVIAKKGYANFLMKKERMSRKKSERESKESEQYYRILFEQSNEAIITFNSKGEINDANMKAVELTGYPYDELINKSFYSLFLPEIVDQCKKEMTTLETIGHCVFNSKLKKQNGTSINIEINGRVIDKFKGIIQMVISDVSIKNSVKEAIIEQNRILDALINNIPYPMFYKDKEGKYLAFNSSFLKYLGKENQDIKGKTIYDLKAKKEADEVYLEDINLIKTGNHIQFEKKIEFADKLLHDIIVNKTLVMDNNRELEGIAGALIDITDYKKVENALLQHKLFLDRIIETIHIPIFYKDNEGHYKGCNEAFSKLIGLPIERIINNTVHNILPYEQALMFQKHDNNLIETKESIDVVTDIIKADGNIQKVRIIKSLLKNTEGEDIGLVGIVLAS